MEETMYPACEHCEKRRNGRWRKLGSHEFWECNVCADVSERKRMFYGDSTILAKKPAEPKATGRENAKIMRRANIAKSARNKGNLNKGIRDDN